MKRSFLLAALLASATCATAQLLDTTIATVDLEEFVPITTRMVRPEIERREGILGRTMTQNERRAVLDEFIDDELLTQAATREGYTISRSDVEELLARERMSLGQNVSEAQYRTFIQQQTGLSWEAYRTEVEKRLLQERFVVAESQDLVATIAGPTERDVRRFYEENAVEFVRPAMVRFDHLFFDTRGRPSDEQVTIRRRANTIAGNIRGGRTTFDAELTGALDDVTLGGGDFGYLVLTDPLAREQLGSAFMETLFFDLQPGEVSGVISSSLGYHIVRIRDRRAPKLLEPADPVLPGESVTVRQEIENALFAQEQQRVFQQAARRALSELRQTADINIDADRLTW